ncbi:MAG: serine acetyltransferase [Dysgonamonadaceae bacterium]|jgi:serine O-acetyltransferase|nr:serine acetyltransferase [Dysgonamonadaceae bacterium]
MTKNRKMTNQEIEQNVTALSDTDNPHYRYIPLYDKALPSIKKIGEIMLIIRDVIFPGYFGNMQSDNCSWQNHIEVNLRKLHALLFEQVYNARIFNSKDEMEEAACRDKAQRFINKLPEIKRLLSTDVKAIHDNDPAAKHYGEIILCYPAIKAMLHHRIAHELHLLKIPLIPRIISEMAHEETGIDIHPGAEIGEYFSIDHGTGVVVGQTSIIGNHVCLYQGVTLGAKSFVLDEDGHPLDMPRHPIIEDNVTIYSNSSILGRIVIGTGTIIGGNVWLTHSVPPHSRILQSKVQEGLFSDGLGI